MGDHVETKDVGAWRAAFLHVDALDIASAKSALETIAEWQARTELLAQGLRTGREQTTVEAIIGGVTGNPFFSLTPGLPDDNSRASLRQQTGVYAEVATGLLAKVSSGELPQTAPWPFMFDLRRLVDISATALIAADGGVQERNAIPQQLDKDIADNAKDLGGKLIFGLSAGALVLGLVVVGGVIYATKE